MNSIPEIMEIDKPKRVSCNCTPKCTKFFRVNGIDVYCKKLLEQLAVKILNTVNGTMIANGNFNNRGWTTKQEQELIKFVEENGVRFGTYRVLAEMFGKTREQVKFKVYKLEKEGRLVRPLQNPNL